MKEIRITDTMLTRFRQALKEAEKSDATLEKYLGM